MEASLYVTESSLKKPIIRAIRQAAKSRIFNIESIDLEFSNGAQRTYERIQTPMDAVIVVPFINEDEFILVKEYSAATETYELSLPKGTIDPGEEPIETANRELREEIGYRAESLRYIRPLNIAPGYIRHVTHVIAAFDLVEDELEVI